MTTEKQCSRERIIAYLDGELAPREEFLLEKHAANCENCRAELNLQKRLFSLLDSALDKKAEIELPENFAKVVATRAETNVKGLRSKGERFRALLLCAALFSITVAGLGAETKTAFASFGKFGEQALTVLNFIWHLAYDLIVGITVILRSVGNQPNFNLASILALAVSAILLSATAFSHYLYQSKRS